MKENTRDEFLTTYDDYADAVFRLCYAKTSSRDEAKDLAQETFIRVWERLSRNPEKIENLRAFVFTVARNLIKDYYKKKKPVLERDLPEGAMEAIGVEPDAAIRSDVRIALAALQTLPDSYRDVLMLHLVEGFPVNEIATMLNERPNTISVRLKRGLAKAREALHAPQP